jgi:capsular exopolysaccharide synthesis family protein
MELGYYLTILWRRKWVIVVTSVVTLAVVVIGTLKATPIYTASTTLRVLTPNTGSIDWVQYDIQYANRLMSTYAEIVITGPVLEELVQKLNLDEPPQVAVKVVVNTELMRISVQDPDPVLAREAANTLTEILVAQSRALYTGGARSAQEILGEQLVQIEDELERARKAYENLVAQSPEAAERIAAAGQSIALKENTYAMLLEEYERARVSETMRANTLSIVEQATTPLAPSKPRKMLNIALGFMVGLGGGVGLAFLYEHLDTTLYTVEQIETATAHSTLAKVPSAGRWKQVALFNGSSPQGEAFRLLRTHIFALERKALTRTLAVTSAEPREGKSTIVASLAYAIAHAGKRVLVVDADLRRPTLHQLFGLSNEVGLGSVLEQVATLEESLQDSQVSGIQALTSGPLVSNPAELLGSQQMVDLVEELAQRFDMILFDTPALMAVADAVILAALVDGVLLVVGRAQAQKGAVQAACQRLSTVEAKLVGVVINRAQQNGRYSYYE